MNWNWNKKAYWESRPDYGSATKVFLQNISNASTVNIYLKNLVPGIYLVKWYTDKKQCCQKITVTNE